MTTYKVSEIVQLNRCLCGARYVRCGGCNHPAAIHYCSVLQASNRTSCAVCGLGYNHAVPCTSEEFKLSRADDAEIESTSKY